MVDYHYDSNISSRLARRRRRIWAAATASVMVLAVIGYIIYDGLTAQTQITETEAATQTLGENVDRKVFDEPTYRLTTNSSWREIESRENSANAVRYQSMVDGLVKRELTIYINDRPSELPVTYVYPVEVAGDSITPLAVSPKCDLLQSDKKNRTDIELSWAGVKFLCDPDLKAFVAAASHNETGYDINVKGKTTDARYTFVYRDLESVPQPGEFQELLRDFQAK